MKLGQIIEVDIDTNHWC